MKETRVCREQTQSLQGVSRGEAPGSSEQQEVCRDGAVSLACLAGFFVFQGHTALCSWGHNREGCSEAVGQHSHKPPGPTDPCSPGIPMLALLQRINDERIAAVPRALQSSL